jgi:hypothetical protein
MRILFWPNRSGVASVRGGRDSMTAVPAPVTSTLRGIDDRLEAISRNTGNLVHAEAPARMFAADPRFSGHSDWRMPNRGDPAEVAAGFAAELNARFDAVCLSFANVIQPFPNGKPTAEANWRKLAAVVRRLEIPVFVFGMGLQEELPVDSGAIPAPLFDLLRAFDERATIFGVRGATTEHWLHALGLKNARALGCPSLYVYPRNVLAIEPPAITARSRIGSAGRLHGGMKRADRCDLLYAVARSFRADYVFQNDIFALFRRHPDLPVFDDATGLVDREAVRAETERGIGDPSPFHGHYFFRDTNRWRMFAHMRDAYVGDRFHGGVVFLQAGRPALFLQADARVSELAAFFDLPTLRVDEARRGNLVPQVAERLSAEAIGRLQETYRRRLAEFVEVCEAAGLAFADQVSVDMALGRPPRPVPGGYDATEDEADAA